MVLRLDGTRRPGLVDCEGVATCCEFCGFSGADDGVVLIDSMADCLAWCDMVQRSGVITSQWSCN